MKYSGRVPSLRMAAIIALALLALAAAVRAAMWMSSRPRGGDEAPAAPATVEVEIPPAAGPSTAAQLDTGGALLDPGKAADAAAEPPPAAR